MPELPEVETCVRGLREHIEGQTIKSVTIRDHRLRWPVPKTLGSLIHKKTIHSIARRAKYIVIDLCDEYLLLHLGMSGTVRIVTTDTPLKKHDHIDIEFQNGSVMRYNDPRRFGSLHHTKDSIESHFLIESLGPEPLSKSFNSQYLYKQCMRRKASIKTVIMNNHVVVGVGNIYANEALFLAKINPLRPAQSLTTQQINELCMHIKAVLKKAIRSGGTTLKDFVSAEGKPGYFQQTLYVYDRSEHPCLICESPLNLVKISGRATVFCPSCQE